MGSDRRGNRTNGATAIVARGARRRALSARGGIAPAALRRVVEFVEAHLGHPLAVEDLAAVLAQHPEAGAAFDALSRSERYQLILGLITTRTPKGRTARLAVAVAQLRGEVRTEEG